MAVVKGSKQVNMRVVEYRPIFSLFLRCTWLLLMIAVGGSAYYFGHQKGIGTNGDARDERDFLLFELNGYTEEVESLRQTVINSEQSNVLDSQALSDVQGVILALREQNAQLEEDVLFYKQIMSPENDEIGLVIGQVDLLFTEEDSRIKYRIEFKQLANNENLINGYANVNILGVQDGQEVSLPLRSLSSTVDDLEITLRFRYFQNLEGELLLPESFSPDKVQIIAVAEGDNSKTIQQSFGWLVENNSLFN